MVDLQALLVKQIEELDRQKEVLIGQLEAINASEKAASGSEQEFASHDCTNQLAVYTAALAVYTTTVQQNELENQAALQVAQAAYSAYYACMYGV